MGLFTVTAFRWIIVTSTMMGKTVRYLYIRCLIVRYRPQFMASISNVGRRDKLFVLCVLLGIDCPASRSANRFNVNSLGREVFPNFYPFAFDWSGIMTFSVLFNKGVRLLHFGSNKDYGTSGSYFVRSKWERPAFLVYFCCIRTIYCRGSHRQFVAFVG